MPDWIPFAVSSIALKDFLLGFFVALALRRGRIDRLIDRWLPPSNDEDQT